MLRGRRGAADVLAVAAILLLAVLLYRRILDLFWLYDLPFHLRLISQYTPADFLVSRRPWNAESNLFKPLFYLSLDLDRAIAGLSPRFFYAHHLAAIAICAASLYALLRLWLDVPLAAAGAALFLIGPSVAATAPVLMARNYFEALALACAAAAAFVAAVRRGRWRWAIAAAALCFLALLMKEVAAPVLIFLALVPEGETRRRLRYLVAPAAAFLAYAVYRAAMTDRPLGGYGWVDRGGFGALLWALPSKVLAALFSNGTLVAAALALALALAYVAIPGRKRFALALTAAAALATVGPVSHELEPRHVIAAWLVLAGAAACGWGALRRGRLRPAVLWIAAVTILAVGAAGRSAWSDEYAVSRRMSVENRAYLALGGNDVLAHPAAATAALGELRAVRPVLGASGAPAGWYQDDLFLCGSQAPARRIWSFEPASGEVRETTRATLAAAPAYCDAIRWEAPLSARFWWKPDGLYWELGPYDGDGYSVVVGDGASRAPVPRSGAYAWESDTLMLRVRYQHPAGWVTYSPPLAVERRRGETRWERSGSAP